MRKPFPYFKSDKRHRRGFTLVEVMISLFIIALLAGAVYSILTTAISASQTTMSEQLTLRRLDAFLRVTRDAFLNLPGEGTITLQAGHSLGDDAEQQLIIGKPQGIFGLPSLAGGSLVLASRAAPDGTRTMTLLKIPPNANEEQQKEAFAAPGIPLLPKLRKPRWTFKDSTPDGDWKEELPEGSPRPVLVRLQMQVDDLPQPVEAIFYVPPIAPPVTVTATPAASPSPSPSPSPGH